MERWTEGRKSKMSMGSTGVGSEGVTKRRREEKQREED